MNNSKGTLYYPLKNKFGNDMTPKIKNNLSTVKFILFLTIIIKNLDINSV